MSMNKIIGFIGTANAAGKLHLNELLDEEVDFIKSVEGIELKAYKDGGGVWTIGIGNTYYEDGKPVKQGDVITLDRAMKLGETIALGFAAHVKKRLTREVNENQFIALVSFVYNVGRAAFDKSTLLKKVNIDPNDRAAIEAEFMKWIYDNGKRVKGLVNRRRAEVKQYFKQTA